jgi:hypothetical protein
MELTFPVVDLSGRQAAATSAGIVTVMKRQYYIHEKLRQFPLCCAQTIGNEAISLAG